MTVRPKNVTVAAAMLLVTWGTGTSQSPTAISTGGTRYAMATIPYSFDLAVEGTACAAIVQVGCVEAVELIMHYGSKYDVLERLPAPFGLAGTVHQGALQLWGPPKGPPYSRVYWVVLVKRAADGTRQVRVLATQRVNSKPGMPTLEAR